MVRNARRPRRVTERPTRPRNRNGRSTARAISAWGRAAIRPLSSLRAVACLCHGRFRRRGLALREPPVQIAPLRRIGDQRQRAAIRRSRLVESSLPPQQIGLRRGQQVIAGQLRDAVPAARSTAARARRRSPGPARRRRSARRSASAAPAAGRGRARRSAASPSRQRSRRARAAPRWPPGSGTARARPRPAPGPAARRLRRSARDASSPRSCSSSGTNSPSQVRRAGRRASIRSISASRPRASLVSGSSSTARRARRMASAIRSGRTSEGASVDA